MKRQSYYITTNIEGNSKTKFYKVANKIKIIFNVDI